MTKARLLPSLSGPDSFTFGPDNIWQPHTSRRFCLILLCPLGADPARPVAPPPLSTASRIHRLPSPATTCSWTLVCSVSCGLLLIKNSHSWQTAPAVMILWDSGRPFEIPLSGQLFGVVPRTQLRILIRDGRLSYHCQYMFNSLVIALILPTLPHPKSCWFFDHTVLMFFSKIINLWSKLTKNAWNISIKIKAYIQGNFKLWLLDWLTSVWSYMCEMYLY